MKPRTQPFPGRQVLKAVNTMEEGVDDPASYYLDCPTCRTSCCFAKNTVSGECGECGHPFRREPEAAEFGWATPGGEGTPKWVSLHLQRVETEMLGIRTTAARTAGDVARLKTEVAVASLMLGVAYDTHLELSGPEPGSPALPQGLQPRQMLHEERRKWLFEKLEMVMVDITKSQKREAAIDMLKYSDIMSFMGGYPVGTRPEGPSGDEGGMFSRRD